MKWYRRGLLQALGLLTVVAAAYLFYRVRPVVIVVLISIILAQAISPIVVRIRRVGARRGQAVLVIYVVMLLALLGVGWLVQRAVVEEAASLSSSLPDLQTRLHSLVDAIPSATVRQAADNAIASPQSSLPATPDPGQLLGSLLAVVGVLFSAFTVLVVTFYWTAERLIIRRTILRFLSPERRERGLQIWDDVEGKLGAWLRGQLILMAAIGAAFGIGLTLLGVKFALVLAIVAAFAEIIPLVGAYVGTAPAVVVALTQSPTLALWVAVFGVLVQLVEANVLAPRVMGKVTGISPLTVILGLLVGTELMGLPGALLAVPVAAGLQVLLVDLGLFNEKAPSVAVEVADGREGPAPRRQVDAVEPALAIPAAPAP
ncbi:MAG TPA: AI-2E family transporter [Chloroflexota bacterium]|nr:AI-2E family transporter [Chloroflexota bacterium]